MAAMDDGPPGNRSLPSAGVKYYRITGNSGCPSADYLYFNRKITCGGFVPEYSESSANEYPRGE